MKPLWTALLALTLTSLASAQEQSRFEPNQSRRTAAVLAPGDYKELFCDGNDWYAIQVPAAQRLEVSARFHHTDGDLDLELLDAQGELLAFSHGSRDEEVLAFDAGGEAMSVFLQVHNASVSYDLHVGLNPSAWNGDRGEGINCWGADWYPLQVGAGQELRVRAKFQDAQGDLDLELLDRDGNQLAISSGRGDGEALRWSSEEAARVLLRVYHVHRGRNVYSLSIGQGARPEQDLAQVFREPRPEGRYQDRMELASGEVLRGRILVERYRLVTPYVDLDLPADQVIGVDLSEPIHQLVTVHGDQFSGFLRTGVIPFLMDGLKTPLEIRRERVQRLVYGQRGDERVDPPLTQSFVLRNGDRFHGELLGKDDWELDLDFARVPLPRDQVESFMFEPDGTATVLRHDQTATRGRLTAETLAVRIEPAPGVSLAFELHPTAFSLIQLTPTEQAGVMRPAQLRHLIRRIAPQAPRELVEAIANGADDLVERLGQLRPLVQTEERGSPELARHIQSLDDSEVAYAWFEVLLRLDEHLRERVVDLISEAQHPEGPRQAAAECVVRLASESGQFQCLERACGSPIAANMVMQAANVLGDQQVLEWLMNRVRRFRSNRNQLADADARKALVELLPTLLERR